MKKRLFCVLIAAILLLGALTGCGDGNTSRGTTDRSDSDRRDTDTSGSEQNAPREDVDEDDPVAVMNARLKAVNDAVNYECLGMEEKVVAGLLFYNLCSAKPLGSDYPEYHPDKPLDYRVTYKMVKQRLEGNVNQDTYAALVKGLSPWNIPVANYSEDNIVETDSLYVYYDYPTSGRAYSRCFILIKDTSILYCLSVTEMWYMGDYYENGVIYYPDASSVSANPEGSMDLTYRGDDVEYVCTPEFWTAFAQTVKFAGDADEEFKNSECLTGSVGSLGRSGKVKVPYVEEWYAGGSMGREAIRKGFESFFDDYTVRIVYEDGSYEMHTIKLDDRDDEIEITLDNGMWAEYEMDQSGFLELMAVYNVLEDGRRERVWSEGKSDEPSPYQNAYGSYVHPRYGCLAIDDFGQGEPTMFYNGALYQYAGLGEVVLLHDFADTFADAGLSEDCWMSVYTDPGRTRLLFVGGAPHSDELWVVDPKTFEITDTLYSYYDMNEEGFFVFEEGSINGVYANEMTANEKIGKWYDECSIWLVSKWSYDELDFYAAWRNYNDRDYRPAGA